ncbi:uncharacterized protein [Solanum tuberosum]|nr:PREDICTED: uncharacterized protein LOC102598751 isoform X2 [Solanum tuberosum]
MKERTTYSGTKMQPLLADSPIRAITCKAGNRICSSLTTENPFLETMLCNICCSEPGFCQDCCCILCCKPISVDYDGYSNIRCGATVDGFICGHVSHLVCSTSLHGWDSRRKHQIGCIEKILNVGICVLRGSQKRSGKELLHRIESIKAKLTKGVRIQDAFKKESCVDSTDIDFDSNMKEMTTSSGTECNLYCLILLFRAITCNAGHIICRSLIIIEAEFGKPEAEADTAFTFFRQSLDFALIWIMFLLFFLFLL